MFKENLIRCAWDHTLVRGQSEESGRTAADSGVRVLGQSKTGHFQDRWKQVG